MPSSGEVAVTVARHQDRTKSLQNEWDEGGMTPRMKIYQSGTLKEKQVTAATQVQAIVRGNRERKRFWAERGFKVNLKYEIHILRKRTDRRHLMFGCFQHALYLLVLVFMIWLQLPGMGEVYELRTSINEFVTGIQTDNGLKFDDVGTMQEFSEWFSQGLFQRLETNDDGTSVYIRTYNQLIGVARVEVERVENDCPWRQPENWNESYRVGGEANQLCFPALNPGTVDTVAFGPRHDPQRFEAEEDPHMPGRWRYLFDFPKDKQFGFLSVNELVDSGFLDGQRTRTAKVRILTYNNGLRRPMLTATDIEAVLTPTGMLTRSATVQSVPVMEYMRDSMWLQITAEAVYVTWTGAQIIWEFVEFSRYARSSDPTLYYFTDYFNFLDWTRFVFIGLATAVRWSLILDTSREFDLDNTKHFVDIGYVARLYDYYNLLKSMITLWSLLSFIQYFNLNTKLRNMRGTLARSGADLLPFMVVFLLFFLVYSMVGVYLFGDTLDEYRTLWKSVNSGFEMMNANFAFQAFIISCLSGSPASICLSGSPASICLSGSPAICLSGSPASAEAGR